MADRGGMVDPAIFQTLQELVDQDTAVRDELRDIIQALEKQERTAVAALSRAHSTPSSDFHKVTSSADSAIQNEISTVKKLSAATSGHPYYKWNQIWSRQMQDVAFTILLFGWLGGHGKGNGEAAAGRLLTIEEVGEAMSIPVNLKDKDAFHLTIEEYLHALISLIDELARLARNSVTVGDFALPLKISQFIKDLHAGFQILNLKNDSLRRRTDGIKYRIKEVEDVVYDLSLRNLIPRPSEE